MTNSTDLHDLRAALLSLTPGQQAAAESLAAGATHQEAADAAGVTRETVTRWAGHLPAFRAALNRCRAVTASQQIETIRRIRTKALDAIETALDDGTIDPLAVLKAVDPPMSGGPVTAEAILDQEMNSTRLNLPPVPPPRNLAEQLEQLDNPPPSDLERAEALTLARLASAAGLITIDELDPH